MHVRMGRRFSVRFCRAEGVPSQDRLFRLTLFYAGPPLAGFTRTALVMGSGQLSSFTRISCRS
jgi:hypothetical protein